MTTSSADLVTLLPWQHELVSALGGQDPQTEEELLDFFVLDRYLHVVVDHDAARSRLSIFVLLPTDDEHTVRQWVEDRPAVSSGSLEVVSTDPGEWRPCLIFDRLDSTTAWSADPMIDEIAATADAWITHITGPADDPVSIPPINAWLLKGSEASFPTTSSLEELQDAARDGDFPLLWTVAPQTRAGDLVLLYFMSPRKAVHFVARAVEDAFFSSEIEVNATGEVSPAQWWAALTPPLPVDPISVGDLREAAAGHLPLRGRSGLFLRPDTIAALDFSPPRADVEAVAQVPAGIADLPEPSAMTWGQWRCVAAGALKLEEQVSMYLVEPMLRLLLGSEGLTWTREHPVGRRWADFVVLRGDQPVHVIEVKKAVRRGRGGWADSPDLRQARWYAARLEVPATLMDANRVYLVSNDASAAVVELDRHSCGPEELDTIRRHLLGAPDPS